MTEEEGNGENQGGHQAVYKSSEKGRGGEERPASDGGGGRGGGREGLRVGCQQVEGEGGQETG